MHRKWWTLLDLNVARFYRAMRIDDGFVLGKYIFCKVIKYINVWLDMHRKWWTLLDLNVGRFYLR